MKYSLAITSLSVSAMAHMTHVPRGFNHTALAKRFDNRAYTLDFEARGQSFFDGWDAYTDADPTHGQVQFVGLDDARNLGLVSVNENGNAIMKVDSTNDLALGQARNSVRIQSKQQFASPSLIVIDAVHLPFGCGVWPAFWSFGDNWPTNGEIDIIEGVNNQVNNQATLHTLPGCTQSGTGFRSTVLSATCDTAANGNAGCGVVDTTGNSYGAAASSVGGGVWAALFDDTGIYYWHFQRGSIPADISVDSTTPNPATWGPPVAQWSSSTCPTTQFYGPQNLIFDITLCGDWAGATFTNDGCGASCTDIVQTGSNFLNAFWEVSYVRVFH